MSILYRKPDSTATVTLRKKNGDATPPTPETKMLSYPNPLHNGELMYWQSGLVRGDHTTCEPFRAHSKQLPSRCVPNAAVLLAGHHETNGASLF